MALGDVDGDGDLDGFVVNSGQANRVWLNSEGVVAVAPPPNSHSAAVSTNLTVTVSSLVSETSVTTGTFVVHGGFQGHLDGGFGFSKTMTRSLFAFDPVRELHAGELVQASVSGGVLERDGEKIAPYVWQFRSGVSAGSGRFVDSGQNLGSSDSRGVALGDVDGDGDLDAFVANAYEQANRA